MIDSLFVLRNRRLVFIARLGQRKRPTWLHRHQHHPAPIVMRFRPNSAAHWLSIRSSDPSCRQEGGGGGGGGEIADGPLFSKVRPLSPRPISPLAPLGALGWAGQAGAQWARSNSLGVTSLTLWQQNVRQAAGANSRPLASWSWLWPPGWAHCGNNELAPPLSWLRSLQRLRNFLPSAPLAIAYILGTKLKNIYIYIYPAS